MAEEVKAETTDFKDVELASSIPESLRENFTEIKTVTDLAKAFSDQKETLSKEVAVTKEDSADDIIQKSRKFYGIDDSSKYKIPEFEHEEKSRISEVVKKFGIHPAQASLALKGVMEVLKDGSLKKTTKESDLYAKEYKGIFSKVDNKDEVEGRAINKLGVTKEVFQKNLGIYANHPLVGKMLLSLGTQDASKAKSDNPVGTQSETASAGIDQFNKDKEYIKSMMSNSNSPLYNPKSPTYNTTQNKVKEARDRIVSYAKKHNLKTTL